MFYPWFKLDALNGFIVLAAILSSLLTLVYSWRFIKRGNGRALYYIYIILTAAGSIGALLSNNLILLAILWGFLGLTLYLLINMAGVTDVSGNNGYVPPDEQAVSINNRNASNAVSAAKKTLIIIGGTDAVMLLGIGIIYYISGTMQIDKIRIPLGGNFAFLSVTAYLCVAAACFAKAGAMPFHSWVPDCAENAPVSVAAFLPASLDKLLGIYLLARISMDLFVLNQGMNIFLMLIGAVTIIAAVMMALAQHNMKRLLGYHAVSQVGYMALGIGTGTPIGIAGSLFHMLNNSIYKQALFFGAGNVEQKTGTTRMDKLGGLSRAMPLTYLFCLVASLSISGIPPFNGFVSKWMVYQGLIERLSSIGSGRLVTILCLAAAMVGSGLTLASFMKLLHAVFLGQRTNEPKNRRISEVPWQMWVPGVVLAVICVLFGVFAAQLPLKYFILPAVAGASFIGSWYAGLSTLLIIVGLLLGVFIFKLKAIKSLIRQDTAYVGAEGVDLAESRVTGTEFYNTIQEFGILKGIYARAEKGSFDIYEQGKALVFGIGRFLQFLHNGILPTYLVWTLLGMIALFLLLMG